MLLDINSISYGKNIILSNTLIRLDKGIIGIYGNNGQGKTTFLKVLSDLFQHKSNNLISNDSVKFKKTRDYILYHTNYFSREEKEEFKRILKDIHYIHHKKIHKLSSGNFNKLKLAISLSQEKDIYILDEPFNALDKSSIDILYLILKEKRELDKLIIVVTHNIEYYKYIFDDIYNLDDGKILRKHNNLKYICIIKIESTEIKKHLSNIMGIESYKMFNYEVYKFDKDALSKFINILEKYNVINNIIELKQYIY